jgi:hypothetical protein
MGTVICIGPFQVKTDAPVTVKQFVMTTLGGPNGGLVDDTSWTALAEEIWKSDANAHLREVTRTSAIAESSSPADLLLLEDEWVYLPQATPSPYVLSVAWPDANASDSDIVKAVMDDVAEHADSGLHLPGDTITIDEIKEVLFNAALRNASSSASGPQPVYYFRVPLVSTIVDAVPTTSGAPNVNPVFGTPDWLPTLWHWIDKLHVALEAHRAAVEDLDFIKGTGQGIVALLTKMDNFLGVYAKYASGDTSSAASLKTRVETLRTAVADGLVKPDAPLPQLQKVTDAWTVVDAIVNAAPFLEAYGKFDGVRDRYPGTSSALDIATARYFVCGAHTPGASDDCCSRAAQAVDSLAPPDGSVVGKQLANTLHVLSNVPAAGVAIIGDIPGPSTLTIAIAKVVAFWRLARGDEFSDVADTSNKIFLWVAASLSFKASSITELAAMFQDNPEGAQALGRKIAQREIWVSGQKQAWMTGSVGLLSLFLLANAIVTGKEDYDKNAPWYTIGQDLSSFGGTTSALVGTAADLLKATKAAGKSAALKDICEKYAARAGKAVGIAAIVVALFDVAEALSPGGDRTKLLDAIGSILVGVESFLPMALTKWAPQLCESAGAAVARITLGVGARTAAAEAAAYGGTALEAGGVLAGAEAIGALLSGIGGLILVGLIVYRNRKALRQSGPEVLCQEWLDGIAAARAVKVGPQDVRTALENCKSALDQASLSPLNGFAPDVRDDLKDAGLDNGDINMVVVHSDNVLAL